MEQLLLHLLGDYGLQSDWMALNKTKRTWPCLIHVVLYTLPFILLTRSWKALLIIGGTHFIIDRFNFVRRLIWLKNHLNPDFDYADWEHSKLTGYNDGGTWPPGLEDLTGKGTQRPVWITIWLFIITDNTTHLLCNYLALRFAE